MGFMQLKVPVYFLNSPQRRVYIFQLDIAFPRIFFLMKGRISTNSLMKMLISMNRYWMIHRMHIPKSKNYSDIQKSVCLQEE